MTSGLAEHLAQEGPTLTENQYEFQQERSMMDAIERFKSNAQAALSQGGEGGTGDVNKHCERLQLHIVGLDKEDTI